MRKIGTGVHRKNMGKRACALGGRHLAPCRQADGVRHQGSACCTHKHRTCNACALPNAVYTKIVVASATGKQSQQTSLFIFVCL